MTGSGGFPSSYEAASARLIDRVERACSAEAEWPDGVRAAVAAGLRFLAAEPATARLIFLDPFEAGREARLRHEETLTRLAELLRAGRDRVEAEPMPELLEEAMVGSLTHLVGRPLRAGEPDLLPALGPELTALLLTPYIGGEEAESLAGGAS